MKLFDKLKNALFEEEYIEVEEKEKKSRKEKKEKQNKIKPTIVQKEDSSDDTYEEHKPIAKRIIPKEKVDTSVKEDYKDQDSLLDINREVKITMIDDDDLVTQNTYPELPPISEVTRKRTDSVNYDEVLPAEEDTEPLVKEEVVREEVIEERPVKLYQATKKESYLENYTPHEYGNYEKQRIKETFKPSPIISPVYGIVEDTRFMEKPKREIRITTSISHDKINIDDIRRKAYGNLSDDIGDNIGFNKTEIMDDALEETEEEKDDNVLLDLSNDDSTPEVNNLTVGDAAMYFEDLGLEYNEDYIDAEKTTRTSKLEKNEKKQEETDVELPKFIDKNMDDTDEVIVKDKDSDDTTDSDNLFDLIDSMYE